MLLAIDVGNTNITFALFEKGEEEIKMSFRLTTATVRTSDEYGATIISIIQDRGFAARDIRACIMASVVPDVMYGLTSAIIKYLAVQPMIVGPGTKTGIRLIKTNPSEVGPDRMVDGVAALALFGGPVIVADFGTATKFDYFNADHGFEGAVTCPGIKLSAAALRTGTARLPEVEIINPGTCLPKDTVTSIQAGILFGRVGEAEYIIDRIKKEAGVPDIKVVATGGLAYIIADETDRIDIIEPNLTMYGLRIIYEKNK